MVAFKSLIFLIATIFASPIPSEASAEEAAGFGNHHFENFGDFGYGIGRHNLDYGHGFDDYHNGGYDGHHGDHYDDHHDDYHGDYHHDDHHGDWDHYDDYHHDDYDHHDDHY